MKLRPVFKFPMVSVMVILGLYVLFTGIALLSNWTLDWGLVRDQLWGARCTLLAIGGIIAGVLRVSSFHPRFAGRYALWLSATPWHPGIDLPLGPVAFVLEDLLFVVPLTALAMFDAGVPAWVPMTCYVLGYASICVASLRSNLTAWFALGLVFLAGLPALWCRQIAMLYAVLLVTVIIAHVALAISLRHFPWDLGDSMRDSKRRPRFGLAWPIDRMGPADPVEPIRSSVGFAIAAVFGWWTYVLLTLLWGWGDGMGQMLTQMIIVHQLPVFGCVFAVMRLIPYCILYWPPISLWGRVRTGRWIIPGYDSVFITPLLMCAVSFGLPRFLPSHLSVISVGVITVTLIAALHLNGGPTLRSWQLTGHHRMFPGGRREPPMPKGRSGRR